MLTPNFIGRVVVVSNLQWAVREGPWKLIGNPFDTSHATHVKLEETRFLIHLSDDPSESQNLAPIPTRSRNLKRLISTGPRGGNLRRDDSGRP